MASVILSAAGQAAAPGVGGFLLGQAGRLAGGFVDRQVFGTPSYHGPRLDNLQVQDSRYGAGIPKIYGRARVAGQVIWASAINETRHEQQVGGKGGGSARAATQISYTYSVSFAVLLCEGIIQGLGAVWADGKMVFDGTSWASGLVDSVNVYTGTTTQTADGVMEAALGVGNIPAYRGVAYVVFENFQLAAFGNRLPNLTFDVQAAAASTAPAWMGTTEVDKTNLLDVLSHPGAALPIITAGTAADAREIVVFAVEGSGTTATLQALFYNTTSEVPALTQQVNSATFTSTDPVNDVVWAASPDERYVVVQVQNTAASPNTAHVFLFDRVLRQFGARTQISLVSDRRSLHWISSTDMVTQEAQGGVRGLRWYQRQGNTIVDRGFVGVWGAGSATTRYAVSYSNFLPVAGGLMMLTYNATTNPTTLYGCFVSVAGNNFSVGTPFTITSAIPATSGDEPVCVNVEGDEWLLFLATSTQVRLLTFTLSPSAATITRAWTNLSLGGTSLWQMICPLSSSRMGVLMRRTTE
ncbi:MAG: hypothetical protein EBQ89_05325, partial [Alphaproteobacteria bacterium]|nr:hypothetical protein [Alphaproteobacteria bacterium]